MWKKELLLERAWTPGCYNSHQSWLPTGHKGQNVPQQRPARCSPNPFSLLPEQAPYITFPSPFELRKPRDGVRPEENQQECSPLLILFSHLLDGWKWHEGALWGSREWWTLDGERRTRVSEWLCAASPSPASTRLKWAMPLSVAPLRQPTLTSWLALLSPLELLFFSHLTHFIYSQYLPGLRRRLNV